MHTFCCVIFLWFSIMTTKPAVLTSEETQLAYHRTEQIPTKEIKRPRNLQYHRMRL